MATGDPAFGGLPRLERSWLVSVAEHGAGLRVDLIAALYVETGGVYYGLPDVDPWDEARDARLYDGPWPVVAHPPCAAWCRWSWLRERDGFGRRCEDGGMVRAALDAVRRYGGILEHPADSLAWSYFGLPEPLGPEWQLTTAGWVVAVDQADYGLRAHKPTWLLYVGADPTPLVATHDATNAKPGPKHLHSGHRHRTPPAFRDALLAMARTASPALA
jgi:hypothetical protein